MHSFIDAYFTPKAGTSIPVIASTLVNTLHPLCVELSNTIALAFPELEQETSSPKIGSKLRIFSSEVNLPSIRAFIKASTISRFLELSDIRIVDPEEVNQKEAYGRMRVPNIVKNYDLPHIDKAIQKREELATKALLYPYLQLVSNSSGTAQGARPFRMYIQRIAFDQERPVAPSPNSYGLSSYQKPFWLPKV